MEILRDFLHHGHIDVEIQVILGFRQLRAAVQGLIFIEEQEDLPIYVLFRSLTISYT
jgi:hypothetical protein